jgi:hypothetical protein
MHALACERHVQLRQIRGSIIVDHSTRFRLTVALDDPATLFPVSVLLIAGLQPDGDPDY